MHFRNRTSAGSNLATVLASYRDSDAVVYALPRGGIVVGAEVATALELPLDIVVARKIGHPYNPEYAVCAVTENGAPVCNDIEAATLDHKWLAAAVREARLEAARRHEFYAQDHVMIPADGRTAILVDDGAATGLTLVAALRELREQRPSRIVAALPVAPADVADQLAVEADEVVILNKDSAFLGTVGAYYDEFPQVTDEDVIDILKRSRQRKQ